MTTDKEKTKTKFEHGFYIQCYKKSVISEKHFNNMACISLCAHICAGLTVFCVKMPGAAGQEIV